MIIWLLHLQFPEMIEFYSIGVAKLLIKEFSCNAKSGSN